MADITEYEHPTDYVVIPVAMRDRLWERFQKSEARVKELETEIVRLNKELDAYMLRTISEEDR